MNYRTMVKGALAFSLSLIVGSSWAATTTPNDVPIYGATFESAVSTVAPLNDYAYQLNSGITNQNYRDEQAAKGWFAGSADDESKVIAGGPAGSAQALQLNTDSATLTNKLAAADKTAFNNALAAKGAYIETEVKFVASDTADAGIKGGQDATKFAIYAYVNENVEPNTTNLVVFHAYQDYDDPTLEEQGYIGYTNEVFSGVTINTEAYTKLRIVMRQIDDNGTPRNLFSVSINGGEPLASAEGLDYEDDIWFLTVEDVGSDLDNTQVSSLSFKGTGEIDNISVGTIVETTVYDITATVTGGTIATNGQSAVSGGTYALHTGDAVSFTATEGYKLSSVTTNGVSVADIDTDATGYEYIVGTTDATVNVVFAEPLAIGTVIFLADDGSRQLQNSDWPIDDIPSYTNDAPTKAATSEGIYTFAGWTNAVAGGVLYAPTDALPAVVAGGATYTAVFTSVPAVASVDGTYYATLAAAVAAATGTANPVVLNGNVALDDWILVDGAVTLDLAGYTISKGANWSTATPAHDALIAVVHGGSLTLDDSSDPSTGVVDGSALAVGIKMTIAGDTNDANAATLVVNAGTVKGQNYGISGHGGAGRGNTAITINGGTILGTDATGDSCGIFHPQAGTLTINGGHIEGGQGVWMKSGTCTCTVNAGEIVGNAPAAAYVASQNGFNSTGDAFVVDNVGYPGGAPVPSILGGTFVSSNANAVASYANAQNEPVGGFISGGSFSTVVDADYCVEGYEPVTEADPVTGLYSVQPIATYEITVTVTGGTISTGNVAVATGTTLVVPAGTEIAFAADTDYTLSSVTTNNLAVAGIDTTATAYTYTVGDSDATVAVVFAAPAPAATVISVAKLSATGAMVNDAAPTLTATVTDENGDAVAATDYTIDASAIDMTTAGLYPVIITATGAGYAGTLTNYYAVMSLTWFNGTPTQKALINPQNMTLTGAHYMHTTQDGAYLAIGASNGNGTGSGHALYSVATLTSIYGTCQGVWEVAHFTNGGGKGMTANTLSGIMLNGGGTVGGTQPTQSTFKGYDISDLANIGTSSNMVQETYTAEWAGSGYTAGQVMDGIDFNHAGTKIFGNNAGTDGPWVYQLAVDKTAKTLTWEATYTTDLGRVRSVSAYYIDGKDYVFVGEGAGSGHGEIAVIDPSDGSITKICTAADDFTTAEFPAGRYFTNVKVSGIASGEMYLYGCTDKGEVVVWALGHDAVTGEWKTAPVGNITSAQTAALNSKASVGNCRAFEVSDDNNAGFLYVQSSPGQFAVVTDISLAQRKALASATLTPAGSDKDVALGAITATVLDENGDTVAASEYTITTNLIDIATAGEYTVTITPVEGSVYSNAVTAVYTISEPAAGYNYPEGGAIEDAAVVAWLTAKGFTQAQVTALGTNAKLNECYLLNCDISQAGAGGSIAITAITVTGSSVTVTVELDRTGGYTGGINGELKLYGKADLAAAGDFADTEATVGDAKFASDTSTTATLSGGTAKFFRAVVE